MAVASGGGWAASPQETGTVGDALTVGDQLLGGLEFADDHLRCVPSAFHSKVYCPVWRVEEDHS